MTLDEDTGASKQPKRVDEDLPWVLDSKRMENWSDKALYEFEKSFREWLFKAMKSTSWKISARRGHWNEGSRMTFDYVRQHFSIDYRDKKYCAYLMKLCKHYARSIKHNKQPIEIKGKRHSKTGFYFPLTPEKVKAPYSLRLKFEMMMEAGEDVTDLRKLPNPDKWEKNLVEANETRKRQNAKAKEYYLRHKEKYGTNSSSNEDTNSSS